MKLIRALNLLTTKEKRELMHFAKYQLKDENAKVLQVLSAIIDSTVGQSDSIDKKLIWVKVNGDIEYNDGVVRKWFNQLLNVLYDFLRHDELKSRNLESTKLLIDSIEKRSMGFLYPEISRKSRKTDIPTDARNYIDLYNSFKIPYDIGSNIINLENKTLEYKQIDFDQMHNTLNLYYSIEQLRLVILEDHASKLSGSERNVIDLRGKLDLREGLFTNILYEIYSMIYKLIGKKRIDFAVIDYVINLINKEQSISEKEHKTVHQTIMNILTRSTDQRRFKYLFELYKVAQKRNILLENGILATSNYRNMVIVACRVNEFEWALEFIERYKSKLLKEHAQSAYSFSKARIYGNKGDHEEVIKILRNVEYEDITYNLNSRLFLIVAFYELDEYDTLDSTIKAFKVFLRRRRDISVKRKKNFRDFCDIVYNLVRAGYKNDKTRLTKSSDILVANPGIPSSWWLKEKLAEVSLKLGVTAEESQTS